MRTALVDKRKGNSTVVWRIAIAKLVLLWIIGAAGF